MNYLRNQEQITSFCRENKLEEISIVKISDHAESQMDLSFLGYFQSMVDDGFYTYIKRGGHKTQDNKFGAENAVLDFLLNSKVFSDTSGDNANKSNDAFGKLAESGKIVKLFGKMKGGKITEILALNTGDYYGSNPYMDRKDFQSVDLWF